MSTSLVRSPLFQLSLLALLGAMFPASVRAIEPDSPEVKAAIQRGITFLEGTAAGDMGHRALVGLTFCKFGADKTHPKIKEALDSVRGIAKNAEQLNDNIYPTGVAILFLCALDPSEYRQDIEALVKSLHRRQKNHGAWGYPAGNHAATCDTSMTQYAVLGMWEAEDQAGVPTPPQVWDRAAAWVLLTQGLDGGFGYQGHPANNFETRTKQDNSSHSMTAAAMGSLYIIKDRVGLSELKKPAMDDTPAALKPFENPEERKARLKTQIDEKFFTRTQSSGDAWMNKNFTIEKPTGWLHYYLYALERYESLREAEMRKKELDKSPRWYEQGARFLLRTQNVNGSWESQSKEVADTCFGILFLLRSTKKSLEKSSFAKFEAGVMVGGRGLPAANDVRLRAGQVVAAPLAGTTPELLAVCANPKHPNYKKAIEGLHDLADVGEPSVLKENGPALAKLALIGKGDARLAAIRAISRSRDLDQVPVLIHLLNDANFDVLRESRDALRGISRKFDGIGPGLRPTADERAKAIDQWKAWYLSIRPDAELEVIVPEPEINLSAS